MTFTKQSLVWVGPENGLWTDAANWQVAGEPAENPPTANDTVTIPENSVVVIDANQTFGTMTLGEGVSFKVLFTDENLSFTIPAGMTAEQISAIGPYTTAEVDGVLTATRVASTFVWSDAVGNGVWTERGNWIVKDAPTGVIPGREDTVIFPSRTEGCWSVAMGDVECIVAKVTLNADVLFTGKTLRPYAIEGEGAIKMGNGFVLAHPGAGLEFANRLRPLPTARRIELGFLFRANSALRLMAI